MKLMKSTVTRISFTKEEIEAIDRTTTTLYAIRLNMTNSTTLEACESSFNFKEVDDVITILEHLIESETILPYLENPPRLDIISTL